MPKLFLSHSSKDKEFVKKLASDLIEFGHKIWLDEWEIRVGECILSKIEEGIETSDYVVIILSENAVKSTWVEKEWKTKYWEEIKENNISVLPIIKEDCQIPSLLKTKKYADFSKSYLVGLNNLVTSLKGYSDHFGIKNLDNKNNLPHKISQVLQKVQSGKDKLSQCITECLTIANELNDEKLERFCITELKGLTNEKEYKDFEHRRIDAFASTNQINTNWVGWNGNLSNAIESMKNNPDEFWPTKFMIWQPIFELEDILEDDRLDKKLFSISLKAKDLNLDTSDPDLEVHIYAKAKTFNSVVLKTRKRLTELLLDKL